MFEECKTLAELNAARIKAVTSGVNITEVNNAYNAARYDILNRRKPFTVVSFKPVPDPKPTLYQTIPLGGTSNEPGTIVFDGEKFYV